MSDFVSALLDVNSLSDAAYVEPYAGGAGLALNLLSSNSVDCIYLNDFDRSIYAFWHSVLHECDALCSLMADTKVTIREWKKQKSVQANKDKADLLKLGFSTLFLNRTNRSGIIEGAGPIGGYGQKGEWKIDARYYKETIIKRIKDVAAKADRIHISNMDAIEFLRETKFPKSSLFYLDPPYFAKGHRLYKNFYRPDDHKKIADFVQSELPENWIVSYDNVPDIEKLYIDRKSIKYDLPYSVARRYEGSEIIFFSDNLHIPNVESPLKVA